MPVIRTDQTSWRRQRRTDCDARTRAYGRWTCQDLNLGPHQAYSRDAFKQLEGRPPGYRVREDDRGCPLDTGVVRPMWHAGGTAGEDQRGTPPRSRQGEGVFGRPPADTTWPLFTVDIDALRGVTIASGVVATAV